MYKTIAFLIALTLLTACAGSTVSTALPPQPPVPSPLPPEPVGTQPPADQPPAPVAGENPYAPQPGDDRLTRANAFLDSAQLLIRETYPPQIELALQGALPTPCNRLRVEIKAPDAEKRIYVEVYSLADTKLACAQVLAPFEASVMLGSFPSGHYTVWVNGNQTGEFDA